MPIVSFLHWSVRIMFASFKHIVIKLNCFSHTPRSGIRTSRSQMNQYIGSIIGILLYFSQLCESGKIVFVNNTVLKLENEKAIEPRLFFADTPDGSLSIIGSWFTFTSFTLSLAFFGIAFMLACIATASYYVLMVVTEPSQQHR